MQQLVPQSGVVDDLSGFVEELELVLLEVVTHEPLGEVVLLHHVDHFLLELLVLFHDVLYQQVAAFVHFQQGLPHDRDGIVQGRQIVREGLGLLPVVNLEDRHHLLDVEVIFQLAVLLEDLADMSQVLAEHVFEGHSSELGNFPLVLLHHLKVVEVQVGAYQVCHGLHGFHVDLVHLRVD